MLLVTHSGSFHADDVLAVALATLLHPNAQVLRTRHPGVIGQADWRIDVGGAFNSETGDFDHHFSSSPVRDNGVRYSSASLVWREHGVEMLLRSVPSIGRTKAENAAALIDEMLFWGIDRIDNGQEGVQPQEQILAETLGKYNLTWTERPQVFADVEPAITAHFFHAVARVRPVLIRMLGRVARSTSPQEVRQHAQSATKELVDVSHDRQSAHAKAVEAARPVLRAIMVDQRFGHGVLRLDNPSLPWADLVHNLEAETGLHFTHVLKQETSGLWIATAVPTAPRGFTSRIPFPAAWAGEREANLARIAGLEKAAFCHVNRFISGWHDAVTATEAIRRTKSMAAVA